MPRHARRSSFPSAEKGSHLGATRRDFLLGAVSSLGILAFTQFGCGGVSQSPNGTPSGMPSPETSGIEHIVLVMMENRSFDHFLGWLPNADGRQAGLSYSDGESNHSTFHLAPDFQGCRFRNPDNSYRGGRIEYNGGGCDGWLSDNVNDVFAIGYYTQSDLPFLGQAASAWTVCDRYFAAFMGPTTPNRLYQHAAQTDRLTNIQEPSSLPTIWDSLARAGISRRYYHSSISYLSFWGGKYDAISAPFSQFLGDCAEGRLPQVAYVDPHFGSGAPAQDDDHPPIDIRSGEAFLNSIYQAVTGSPNWPNTVLVINFDEWGGFFDHVAPPNAPIPSADAAAGSTDGLLGFRVPCLIISPFARRGLVSSTVFDHTSVLSMIEWRWSLSALTVRDQNANNLASVLDFSQHDFYAPKFEVSLGPFGEACRSE